MSPLELILSEIPDFGKCRSLLSRKCVGGCGDEKGSGERESPQPPPSSKKIRFADSHLLLARLGKTEKFFGGLSYYIEVE